MAYPDPTNLTSMTLLLDYASNVTSGYLGIVILVVIYFVVFINLKLRGTITQDALTVSGWITIIPAMVLFLMGLISNSQLFYVVAGLAIPLVWSYFSKE